jgi:hypothetical protein
LPAVGAFVGDAPPVGAAVGVGVLWVGAAVDAVGAAVDGAAVVGIAVGAPV